MANASAQSPWTNDQITHLLETHFGLTGELSELPSYIDQNRRLDCGDGNSFVIKLSCEAHSIQGIELENTAMSHLAAAGLSVETPELLDSVDRRVMVQVEDSHGRPWILRVISLLDGKLWAQSDTESLGFARSLGRCLGELDRALACFEQPLALRYINWDLANASAVVASRLQAIDEAGQRQKIESILWDFRTRVQPSFALLPRQIIHNDLNDYNLLVDEAKQRVCGAFDFGDMVETLRVAELAIAGAYALMGKSDPAAYLVAMVAEYHRYCPLHPAELEVLLDMLKMRLAVSLCMSSEQFRKNPDNSYLLVSQKPAWALLHKLDSVDTVSLTIQLHVACGIPPDSAARSHQQLIDFRQTHLSQNLSLAYQQPLKIIRGQGAYLYDDQGRRYLDMVNNVCHVGHCHPKVVAAGQRQMATLNTNTRYLHDNIVEFSDKLLATMPAPLSVCFLVNSGSEANELALRLARNYTGNKGMVVVEGAYHGNTNATVDISPYKFDGAGGKGSPDWVEQTMVPDPYFGEFKGSSHETGLDYAADVAAAIKRLQCKGENFCGFICESIQGVGGQIIHPPGYLQQAYKAVRAAGGLCLADEVQVGMGRVGSHWWAFQTQDAVPDIVTIGKPLGNGHPIAAVVTTEAIAQAFVNGMEYFNTFGGNPVSCAIGSAVMTVIEEEGLMQKALDTGSYLVEGLKRLAQAFPIIGDVRGQGMFIGAELVNNRESRAPAVKQIDFIIEALKQRGILLTTEGPRHNVFKIKPPLAFSIADADFFLSELQQILRQPQAQPD